MAKRLTLLQQTTVAKGLKRGKTKTPAKKRGNAPRRTSKSGNGTRIR